MPHLPYKGPNWLQWPQRLPLHPIFTATSLGLPKTWLQPCHCVPPKPSGTSHLPDYLSPLLPPLPLPISLPLFLSSFFLNFWWYSSKTFDAHHPPRAPVMNTHMKCIHLCIWFVWYIKLVAQSCLTLCDPMDCSPPGFSVHGILQARILEWVAICFSRGSSWPRDQTQVSCIAGRFFTIWATREPPSLSLAL